MLPLLKKPTDGFEGAGEFDKLFFILTLGTEALPDFGGVDLFRGEFNSTDCQNTYLWPARYKKRGFHCLLTVFKVFLLGFC